MKIYHNPRCQKSRQTLALIENSNTEVEIIRYLEDTPSKEELTQIISLLNIKPSELLRTKEKLYKENYKGKEISEEEWIDIMITNPKLIERPIVVKKDKAIIGRPPEKVLELL